MAGGKTYQVTQVDPLNPHTKGMVHQVNIVGGGTQMEELPEASADNVGLVYQYLGETDANFTHGYFYENKAQGTNPETYAWEAIDTQASGVTSTANTDLSNLTAVGKNIANWSNNVTNCITEIPQDIKLELNAGTLTLKAGSKAYLPNGTTYSNTEDVTQNPAQLSGTATWVIAMTGNNSFFPRLVANCVSGAGATTVAGYAYDTTTNVISWYTAQGAVGGTNCSFPIAIIHTTNSVIDRIDQIFNGFGYIGSTVFALPGVKGLIPNGRNSDGTLKNTVLNISNIITTTFTGTAKTTLALKTNIVIEGNGIWYDAANNYIYYSSVSTSPESCLPIATATLTSGTVSDFHPKNNFQAVDYNDVSYLSMPSLRYTDLILGSTGTVYTAPADGYFTINKGGSDGEWVYLRNTNSELTISNLYSASLNARLFMPVARGQTVQIQYTASGTTNMFRFVYANGAK